MEISFSPFLDTDEKEFFQYLEENLNGKYFRNGSEQKMMSFIDHQEHHQNVQKPQRKLLYENKREHHLKNTFQLAKS